MRHLLLPALLVLSGLAAVPARAQVPAFRLPNNHCAPNDRPDIARGGSGFLIGTSAWSEGGACVNLPIERLIQAARNVNALTWNGVTRIVSVENLPRKSGDELSRIRIVYEAYHNNLGCRSATWPMVWTTTLDAGAAEAPDRVEVAGLLVPGGDANGRFIKRLDLHAEFVRVAADRTAVHVRYEVRAPFQKPEDAADTVTNFIARIEDAASGRNLPGPVADPACPYRNKGP